MQRINFIHKELKTGLVIQFDHKVLTRNIILLPAIMICFCLTYTILQKNKIRDLKQAKKSSAMELSMTQRKLDSLAKGQVILCDQIDKWQQKTQLLKDQKNSFDEELKGNIPWSNVLIELARIIPEKTWLNNLIWDKKKLTIEGFASSNTQVNIFLKNLEKSLVFANIEFKSTERRELEEKKKKIVEFQITGRLY